MGQQLPLKECFFDGLVFNKVDMFEEVLEIISPRKTGGNVDSVLQSSLQEISDSSFLHVPAHEDVDIHPEDNVDQQR